MHHTPLMHYLNRRSLLLLLTLLVSFALVAPAAAAPVAAQDALLPEEALAEALLDVCFGKENMDAFYASDMGDQAVVNLFARAGVDDVTRDSFLTDLAAIPDVDLMSFNLLLIDYCLGPDVYPQIAQSINDQTVWVPIFIDLGFVQEQINWFVYYIEYEWDEFNIEVWLIDLGLEDWQIAQIVNVLYDPDAVAAYFAEYGIDEATYEEFVSYEESVYAEVEYTEYAAYEEEYGDIDEEALAAEDIAQEEELAAEEGSDEAAGEEGDEDTVDDGGDADGDGDADTVDDGGEEAGDEGEDVSDDGGDEDTGDEDTVDDGGDDGSDDGEDVSDDGGDDGSDDGSDDGGDEGGDDGGDDGSGDE